MAALILLRGGLLYEAWRWKEWNGLVSCSLLALASLLALSCGHRGFCRKEIGPPSGRIVIPGRWGIWLLVALLGFGLLLVVVGSLVRDFSRVFVGSPFPN